MSIDLTKCDIYSVGLVFSQLAHCNEVKGKREKDVLKEYTEDVVKMR